MIIYKCQISAVGGSPQVALPVPLQCLEGSTSDSLKSDVGLALEWAMTRESLQIYRYKSTKVQL